MPASYQKILGLVQDRFDEIASYKHSHDWKTASEVVVLPLLQEDQ